ISQAGRRRLGVAGSQLFAGGGRELFEAVDVELTFADPQLVSGRPRDEPLRPERLAKLRDIDLECFRRPRRRLVAPEVVHEPVGRHDLVPVKQKEREERAEFRGSKVDRFAADDDLERPEKPELVHAARSSQVLSTDAARLRLTWPPRTIVPTRRRGSSTSSSSCGTRPSTAAPTRPSSASASRESCSRASGSSSSSIPARSSSSTGTSATASRTSGSS